MKFSINTNNMFIEADSYRAIMENSIINTLDVIFLNQKNKILLGLRNNEPLKGVYYIPGGRRLKNEPMLESAKRKMKEELGVDINEQKLEFLGVYDDIFENSMFENTGAHYCPITYLYRLSESEEESICVSDSQHADIRFFDTTDPMLHAMVKVRIRDMKLKNILP